MRCWELVRKDVESRFERIWSDEAGAKPDWARFRTTGDGRCSQRTNLTLTLNLASVYQHVRCMRPS